MVAASYGTTGKILRVDLTTEKIWTETLNDADLKKFLGGTALGVKFLLEMVDPASDWTDPQNIVYIGTGPLGGTRVAVY